MKMTKYYEQYNRSSKLHAENIMKYGPKVPFGYPNPLPEQLKRIDFIIEHAEGDILDLGCDSGYILDKCVGSVGIDISLSRLKAAKHWTFYLNLIQALAEYLPFREVFDTVVASELLEHVLSPEAVLTEAYRVLKPDGKLIITVPDEIHGKSHRNPEHLRKFTEEDIRQILKPQFDIEVTTRIEGSYPAWCFSARKKVNFMADVKVDAKSTFYINKN